MTVAAGLRGLPVLTLDQLSDYCRVLYDQLGGLVDETGLDNEVDETHLRRHLTGADVFHLHWPSGCEWKQTTRVLAALPQMARDLAPAHVALYLRCRQVGYWRPEDMARDLGVADMVSFPRVSPGKRL